MPAEGQLEGNGSGEAKEPVPPPPERAALRRRWANLIRRVYEVDPLACPRCGAGMRSKGGVVGRGPLPQTASPNILSPLPGYGLDTTNRPPIGTLWGALRPHQGGVQEYRALST